MVYYFILLSFFFASLSYLSFDPIKSALFLVLSLLGLLPLISCQLHVWYGYYICLLFLSGIFVIIVYFSSVSSCEVFTFSILGLVLCILLTVLLGYYGLIDYMSDSALNLVVSDVSLVYYVWLVSVLMFYLNFVSSIITFMGALRSFY